MEIALSLGSNLGDRLTNLRSAVAAIRALPTVRDVTLSRVYETEPVDVAAEHRGLRFLNAVVIVKHPDVEQLAPQLRTIERQMGRPTEHGRNEPRLIDIDILYAGGLMLQRADLTLPHPRWAEREFVVRPLADLRPDLVVPGKSQTVGDILLTLPAGGGVVPFSGSFSC